MSINWCYNTSFYNVFSTCTTCFYFYNLVIVSTFQFAREFTVLPTLYYGAKSLLFTLWILYIEFYLYLYTVFCSDYYPLIWFLPSAPLHYYIYFSVLLTNITYQGHYRVTVPVFLHFYFCTTDQLIAFIWFSIYLI